MGLVRYLAGSFSYILHTSSCLGVAFAQLPESHSLPMFIGISSLCAYKQLELFWLYARYTLSCLGVAFVQLSES